MPMFKFSNLLGTVYKKGNVAFNADGFKLISPVGNKVTIYDLKNHTSQTVSVDASHNYTSLALSPNGLLLLAATEIGEIHVITLYSNKRVHLYKAKGQVSHMKFSPDGKFFAIARDTKVFVYNAPTLDLVVNMFAMERVFHDSATKIRSLDWSYDSNLVAFGGDDMVVRIHAVTKLDNFKSSTISGHSGEIVACYFEESTYDMYTISSNGQLCTWEYTTRILPSKEEDSDDDEKMDTEESKSMVFKKTNRFFYDENVKNSYERPKVTCCDFNRNTKFLVTGFSNGNFIIHLMPEFTKIHRFNISEHQIASVAINKNSEWIAFGCPDMGQLVIWEWQSDTFVLKQQGHANAMNCFAYSPDGTRIATGGVDNKVKLWNVSTSFCFMTFDQHTSAVTGVVFTQNGRALLSSSLDGTIRAYDTMRYRNFRTYTSPKSVQFSCVTTDTSGDLVAAGGQDIFEIYMWESKTAKLLTILSGHEGPVAQVIFSPSSESSLLASISWDRTMRVWEAIESSSNKEIVELSAEGTCIAFRPDGKEIVVGTLDGQITFVTVADCSIRGSIECRNHLGSGRSDTDLITAKKTLQAKSFTTIGYSPDGQYVIAGGHSKTICMYYSTQQVLAHKFVVTANKSFDGVSEFVNHRSITEFGNMNLVADRDADGSEKDRLSMPGAKKGDMASRNFKPEVRVSCVAFSPTGRVFGATTTEGLMLFSSDNESVFDPINADQTVTRGNVKKELKAKRFDVALMTALRLNNHNAIQEAVERTPESHILPVCKLIDAKYAQLLLSFLSKEVGTNRHLEFYCTWIKALRETHMRNFQSNFDAIRPHINTLAYNMQEVIMPFNKLVFDNTYKLMFMSMTIKNDKSTNQDQDVSLSGEMKEIDDEVVLSHSISKINTDIPETRAITTNQMEWPFGTDLGPIIEEEPEEEEWNPPLNQTILTNSTQDVKSESDDTDNETYEPTKRKKLKLSLENGFK